MVTTRFHASPRHFKVPPGGSSFFFCSFGHLSAFLACLFQRSFLVYPRNHSLSVQPPFGASLSLFIPHHHQRHTVLPSYHDLRQTVLPSWSFPRLTPKARLSPIPSHFGPPVHPTATGLASRFFQQSPPPRFWFSFFFPYVANGGAPFSLPPLSDRNVLFPLFGYPSGTFNSLFRKNSPFSPQKPLCRASNGLKIVSLFSPPQPNPSLLTAPKDCYVHSCILCTISVVGPPRVRLPFLPLDNLVPPYLGVDSALGAPFIFLLLFVFFVVDSSSRLLTRSCLFFFQNSPVVLTLFPRQASRSPPLQVVPLPATSAWYPFCLPLALCHLFFL